VHEAVASAEFTQMGIIIEFEGCFDWVGVYHFAMAFMDSSAVNLMCMIGYISLHAHVL
jgi:hypothetical protein